MPMTLLIETISLILSAFFGWSGGRGDDYWKAHPRWPRWLLQSWTRDWLIGPVTAATAIYFGVLSPWLLLMILTTGGALSTYWDKLFGYDNFFFYGFIVGLAAFPICFITGHWWILLIRAALLSIWMGLWSGIFKNDHIEDLGRYAPICPSIAILCI